MDALDVPKTENLYTLFRLATGGPAHALPLLAELLSIPTAELTGRSR